MVRLSNCHIQLASYLTSQLQVGMSIQIEKPENRVEPNWKNSRID